MVSCGEEAIRSKALAEKHFAEKNFQAAKKYALRAQELLPGLEGISQMVATFTVYAASEAKFNGELDFYSILGVDQFVHKSKLKRQSKKLALLVHPDNNKTIGTDGAFKLVSEAWDFLSDSSQRNAYDKRRNRVLNGNSGYEDCYKFQSSHGTLDTFWTVCTSCHVQYEYLRKYVNKRLSCKNCRGVFVAVETRNVPYINYSHLPENGYGNHGYGLSCMRTSGSSGHHKGSRSEHSHQRSSFGVLSTSSSTKMNGFHQAAKAKDHVTCKGIDGVKESSKSRRGKPPKKRKVEFTCSNIHGEEEPKAVKAPLVSDTSTRRCSATFGLDTRQLLIEKARSEISLKLEKFKVESEALKRSLSTNEQPEGRKSVCMTISVPDSDFHDFDQDRTEECFQARQIWALYDEEDGMPRLYCLIREVISLNPFKIHISYLSSKSDTEFDSGFTKSCGIFRSFHSETVEQINIFSHILTGKKVGRGGSARIYPKTGDIWAIYRNWTLDWNIITTPQEIRHQYEMVEVLDDYSEETGVWIAPLVKLDGYKTVYRRDDKRESPHCIPRREMLRFSHQVPAYSLKVEDTNLPDGCWDLDPAATPDELLRTETAKCRNSTKMSETQAEE